MTSRHRVIGRGAGLLLALCLGGARAESAPVYRVSYLPDERDNLICFSRDDALDLLASFHDRYMAEARPRAMRLLRSLESQFGQTKRYDCAFIRSIFVPILPVEAVDIAEERGLDWGEAQEHYFVAANLLVGEAKYTKTATGGRIYVFASDVEIEKD